MKLLPKMFIDVFCLFVFLIQLKCYFHQLNYFKIMQNMVGIHKKAIFGFRAEKDLKESNWQKQ